MMTINFFVARNLEELNGEYNASIRIMNTEHAEKDASGAKIGIPLYEKVSV